MSVVDLGLSIRMQVPGSAKKLHDEWEKKYHEHVKSGSILSTPRFMKKLVQDWEKFELTTEERTKPRVGIIGTMCKVEPEFYDWLKDYLVHEEGCEVTVLDFYGYAIAPSYNAQNQQKTYSFPIFMRIGGIATQKMISTFIGWGADALKGSKRFDPMKQMETVLERTWSIVPSTHISGEGWFYTSQFVFLLDQGIDNFICTTPFDCMPVHLGCRGAMKKLKAMFPKLNVCVLDFDAGSSRMNQLNRIRLMLNSMPERQDQGPQTTLCRVGDLEDLISNDDINYSLPTTSSYRVIPQIPSRKTKLQKSNQKTSEFDIEEQNITNSNTDNNIEIDWISRVGLKSGCSPAACSACGANQYCNVLQTAVQGKRAKAAFVGATAKEEEILHKERVAIKA
ncbi:MAG: putative 2-hydroxyglutaryl-CoA dehydratase [Streblomastix strix]|uniref:Putative 2-hydroxyglutaryl-CoA dehydratase n=1 Tax=Streblomastix strix TaxID=222440 RepID=A0A5J4VLU1_9EUKA|nr:MAG: putative 2-hydroxyglutaryl-CoA dehydratase [Streblomastix strix]